MNEGLRQSSLHNLAHVANISQELQMLNQNLQDPNSSYQDNHMSPKGQANRDTNSMLLKNGKPKRMACVECRQQKSRCDAHEKYPAPCSRCAKKGLKCDLKSDYKRTYKRARIAQIEKEFMELKKNLSSAQAAELFHKVPAISSSLVFSEYASNYQARLESPAMMEKLPPIHNSMYPHGDSMNNNHMSSIYQTGDNHNLNSTELLKTPLVARQSDYTSYGPLTVEEDSFTLSEDILACEKKTMGDVSLSSETIKSLYLEYVECYHPILPVVDISKGPSKIYRLCPALFWVIMFVSLRRFQDDSLKSLLLQLSTIVKQILGEITISPITRFNPSIEDEPVLNACSVYSVQAFLLYTFWPPITSSLSADTSWNSIGAALFQAIRIGLHTPRTFLDPESQSQVSSEQHQIAEELARTWIVCNFVSQTIATAFGFPAFVQFESSMWSSCKPDSSIKIPPSIRYMMQIAGFEDQVSKTLNSNPVSLLGFIDALEMLPMLKVLLNQLDELELNFAGRLPLGDEFRKFQILAARVHLLTYYFMDTNRIAPFELRKGLILLYNAAIGLLNHAQYCHAANKKFIRYIPAVYVLTIWQTSCIICKLIHSPLKDFLDVGSGRQSYEAAISLTAKASILKHDMAHRCSGIMRSMWQLFGRLDQNEQTSLSILIKTRRSASLFFDCLYLLRKQVGMQKLNSRYEERNNAPDEDVVEDDASSDSEEYGYQETEHAIKSDDEQEQKDTPNSSDKVSQKSTPGSTASSRTRKHRTLSGATNAESKARKIIRTIPLDPQPISIEEKRSLSSQIYSPGLSRVHPENVLTLRGRQDLPSSDSPKTSRQSKHRTTSAKLSNNIPYGEMGPQDAQNPSTSMYHDSKQTVIQKDNLGLSLPDILKNSPSNKGIDNLDIDSFYFHNDLLWKDVDSVMNDFGFHTQ